MARWNEHPATRRFGKAHLRFGDRAADVIRNGMGSWAFVLAAWIWFNGTDGFDPFPFILLNLVLSCVAALQGAILLIAAKREDRLTPSSRSTRSRWTKRILR
jgi:uncharacterized membrane protein